jgi:hypothetical protein
MNAGEKAECARRVYCCAAAHFEPTFDAVLCRLRTFDAGLEADAVLENQLFLLGIHIESHAGSGVVRAEQPEQAEVV